MHFFLQFVLANTIVGAFLVVNAYAAFNSLVTHDVLFCIAMYIITQLYWSTRVFERFFNIILPQWFFALSSNAFAIFLISFLVTLLTDIFLIITRFVPPLRGIFETVRSNAPIAGAAVIGLILLTYVTGYIFGHIQKISHFTIEMPDGMKKNNVRIVQISDIHITSFTQMWWLNRLVKNINGLNPDIIVITGDIIDSDLKPFVTRNMKKVFKQFHAKYGIYGVMGNHDYYGGHGERAVQVFKRAGIKMLVDEYALIPELGLIIIGRDDYYADKFRENKRIPIQDLADATGREYPIVVLDHQPRHPEEAEKAGVSLQFSGHTHNGQIFPANFVVKRIFKKAWGLWQKNNYSLIVSCGVATWGPPIRLGSYGEIVVADLVKK